MKELISNLRSELAAATAGPWQHTTYIGLEARMITKVGGPIHTMLDAQLIVTLRNNADALLDYIEKLQTNYESAFKRGLKEGKRLADKVIVHNQKMSPVVKAAEKLESQLTEFPTISRNTHTHIELRQALSALDEGKYE